LVLGHDNSGAVSATVKGGEVSGHLDSLVDFIQPAVDNSREMGNISELLNNSIDGNIHNIINKLKESHPILSEKVETGKLMIVGARYHLDSGKVQNFK
jgi:carbonic anhydrase